MRLLLDLQCVQSTSSVRGIGRYALCLARGLVEQAGDHRVEVLLAAGNDPGRLMRARSALETFLPAHAVHVFDADWPWHHPPETARRLAAEQARQAAISALAPEAVLLGSVFEGDTENVLSVDGSVPTAAVLYDLIPARDPGTYLLGPGAEEYWRRFEDLQRCDLLLAISGYSAEQSRELVPRCPPVVPVWGAPFPSGAFPAFEPSTDAQRTAVPDRFVLTVGGDHPRKNLDRLVAAWGAVPATARRGTALVIACRLNSGTLRRLKRVARRAGLEPADLVLTGEVSEQTLDRLYRDALAFAFPSLEEGLGMPPLEAMARECATVMARGSSLSELSDEPAAFVDGTDVDAMAAVLESLLTDDGLRARLRAAAAATTARFTWNHAADLAWAALETLPATASRPAPAWPAPVPTAGAASLPDRPAPVRLCRQDALALHDDPAEDALQLASPLPRGVRSALAGALAVVADDVSELVAAGVVDVPLLSDGQLEQAAAHDVLARLGARLAAVALMPGRTAALVDAMTPPARWTLQRPRPVWLVLTSSWLDQAEALRRAAEGLGVDLVVAGPGAVSLAASVDLVLVEGAVADEAVLSALHRARCRGALVHVTSPDAPEWASTVASPGPGGWPPVLAELAGGARRTCGWPWRDGA